MPDRSGYTAREEVAHAATHGLALAVSVAGAALLVVRAALHGDAVHVVASAVFGATLVLLYAASTLYHAVPAPRAKRLLRRLDHAAIFLLIAGTYTPLTLVCLRGGLGWTLFAAVWSLALLGVLLETAFPRRVRRVSLALYLGMGWMGVLAAGPMMRALPPEGLALLLAGGLAYTAGVAFYAWRRLPYHHAVWHLFVMAGSALHFSCILAYAVPGA